MRHRMHTRRFTWFAPLLVVGSLYACGSDEGGDLSAGSGSAGSGSGGKAGSGLPSGAACTSDAACASGDCSASGTCASGTNLSDGKSCTTDGECASGDCTSGVCGGPQSGSGAPGAACTLGGDCASGSCVDGKCAASGSGSNPGDGTTTTVGPQWGGSGTGFRPLTTGCGPETATECTGTCEQSGGDPDVTVIRPPATLCFSGEGDLTPDDPAAVIEQVIEKIGDQTYVHIRITFDPSFTDSSFGAGSIGWGNTKNGLHKFSDLTGSDHTELLLTNGDGETVMNFKIDLITADATAECGFAALGVSGGEGKVLVGDASWVLASTTSISRDLNGCGYCESEACAPSGDCTVDSPTTDELYTANPATPDWDYRQVYEVWIDYEAFMAAGFGQAYITYTHSSPSKLATNTLEVVPSPCPPEWDVPYCPPGVVQEGGNCFGTPTGEGGAGGGSGTGGCPPNYQTYVTTEGASSCTPIPYANYPGMAPCPEGYALDTASEGRYCLPI